MAEYNVERNGKNCRVLLAGDLTAASVASVQAGLKAELAKGIEELVFDLRNTVMLDSSGIGLLIAAHNSLSRVQGRLRVTNASADVFRLLQSMRLVSRLNVQARELQEAHHG
jgi:anti-anti-sigma factor